MRTCCLVLLTSLFVGIMNPPVSAREGGDTPEAPGNKPPEKPELMLSLNQAIKIALEKNYDLLLAQERVHESEGVAFSRLGALLPNLRGTSDYRRLKTFQGEFGGLDRSSRPRNIFDSRAHLSQSVFSLSLIRQWLAGRVGVEVADLEAKVAKRDTIATAALFYLVALRAEAAVKARQANVELSERLWKLTEGRKAAGAATGIDVVRAETELENQRRRLIDALTERNRAKLDLVRAMGLPDDTPVVLTDTLELSDAKKLTADDAVLTAMQNRVELEAQARRNKLAALTLGSVVGERFPNLDFQGNYGLIDEDFSPRTNSYSAGGFLTWPLYDGQREGRVSETRSQLRQEELRTRSLIQQIGIEARDAHQALVLTRDQAIVAQRALDLALEQLRLSKKAFSIGTLTHLEVISAQIGVADTRDSAIEALFNFNAADVNLARATGEIENIYSKKRMLVRTRLKATRVKRWTRHSAGGRLSR